jgi:glycosyltransferase involved in cell wall biosynthesis
MLNVDHVNSANKNIIILNDQSDVHLLFCTFLGWVTSVFALLSAGRYFFLLGFIAKHSKGPPEFYGWPGFTERPTAINISCRFRHDWVKDWRNSRSSKPRLLNLSKYSLIEKFLYIWFWCRHVVLYVRVFCVNAHYYEAYKD